MDTLIPIKTTTPKPPPPSEEADHLFCAECRDDDGDRPERPDIRDLTIKELLEEDSGRGDTLRDMSDLARGMLGLPPLEHQIKTDQEEGEESGSSEPEEDRS